MTNRFSSLEIDIWDFIDICLPAVLLAGCLGFEISEFLNTRDIISKDYHSIEYSTVKFHIRVLGSKVITYCLP
jgi:hypothetical protein